MEKYQRSQRIGKQQQQPSPTVHLITPSRPSFHVFSSSFLNPFPALVSYDIHGKVFPFCQKDVIGRPAQIQAVHACSGEALCQKDTTGRPAQFQAVHACSGEALCQKDILLKFREALCQIDAIGHPAQIQTVNACSGEALCQIDAIGRPAQFRLLMHALGKPFVRKMSCLNSDCPCMLRR